MSFSINMSNAEKSKIVRRVKIKKESMSRKDIFKRILVAENVNHLTM